MKNKKNEVQLFEKYRQKNYINRISFWKIKAYIWKNLKQENLFSDR